MAETASEPCRCFNTDKALTTIPFNRNGIMTENETTKPIEVWQIAVHLRAATQMANTVCTAIRIMLMTKAANPVLDELQLLADLAADLHDEIGTLYERCEEALLIAKKPANDAS